MRNVVRIKLTLKYFNYDSFLQFYFYFYFIRSIFYSIGNMKTGIISEIMVTLKLALVSH